MSNLENKFKDLLWALKKNKKAQIIAILIGLLLISLIIAGIVWSMGGKTEVAPPQNNNKNTADVSAETTRRIDGVEVASEVSNLLPQAVMVENLSTIRPQSGMSQANLIYEALAEGGITRFMLIYANDEAIDPIGPVRSARHYFVDWAEEYGGAFYHVGGSPQALGILGTTDYMTDVNQFGYSQYYYRDENLSAPHNLFTNSELLSFALRDLELSDKEGSFDSFAFKEETEKEDRPEEVTPINIEFSSDAYAVEWQYETDSNSYLRFNGGEPHVDANNDEQLTAKNIVVQKVESTLIEEETGRLDVITIGEGDAIVFQDGEVKEGKWIKAERGDRTKFFDENGEEFEFNPGTTWIEVVPVDNEVTY